MEKVEIRIWSYGNTSKVHRLDLYILLPDYTLSSLNFPMPMILVNHILHGFY